MSREEASHAFSASSFSVDAQWLPLELLLPTARTSTVLKQILGLLSLQVLNEESSGCKEEGRCTASRLFHRHACEFPRHACEFPRHALKFLPTATTPKKPLKKKTGWNGLRCAYMMVTFLFVSYNKGDWCYCHYCDPQVDNRNNPCCAF
ncbi:PREDICTED: uncharacterized protein LOC105001448 isoform X2 [Bison bison bison]|uniref:Uncharacterized protein LOC105001448 isoform X2 n=1 Tax=Bison bison bison TaxID=43346 RepID=A0A6P3IP03_BISBB|nr:PREDICTED: uncharacterized protein LOC105001448 isoform X2 [Bison bison bison]